MRFRQEPAHQEIIEFLRALKVKKEIIDGYLMLLNDIYRDQEVDRKQEISRIRQSIDKLKTKITNAEDRLFEGSIDQATFDNAVKRYKDQVDTLEKSLAELKIEGKVFYGYLTKSMILIENLDEFFIKGSVDDKKKLLSVLFPEGLTYAGGQYRTHPENIFISLLISNIRDYNDGNIKKADISASLSSLGCTKGLEPSTFGTTIRRSNQLSYAHRLIGTANIRLNLISAEGHYKISHQ